MKRNPYNTNQVLFSEPVFNGMSIQLHKGPLIEDYLNKAFLCLQRATEQYRCVFMLRLDLHLPKNYPDELTADNVLIEKFFASLRAKIKYSQETKRRSGLRVHRTDVRYIWCRERSTQHRVHYHVAILLNHDAYAHIGDFILISKNMYARSYGAWASALDTEVEKINGLIEIPNNALYSIKSR